MPRSKKPQTVTVDLGGDTDTKDRRIEYVRLKDLVPNPVNPKDHDVALIDQSVGRFGFIEPVVPDGRTGKIISGHGRVETLSGMEARGDSPPDGIELDDDGNWLVPTVVGWSSRSDAEANAALIALNRAGEVGGWVDESLLNLLDELSELEDGYVGVGFTEKDRDDLAKLVADTPDLDDLADDWDGSGMNSGDKLTLKITDPDLIQRWQTHREGFDSDDEALGNLL